MSRRRKRQRQRGQARAAQQPKTHAYSYNSDYGKAGSTAWTSTYSRYCDHFREKFDLPNGKSVYLSAYFDRPNTLAEYRGLPHINVGFYLDNMWGGGKVLSTPGFRPMFSRPEGTKTVVYPWVDQWIPDSARMFLDALRWLDELIKRGATVDIGCLGGHGRTGTTLACLLVLGGMGPWDAIQTVRGDYCKNAIETLRQEQFIYTIAKLVRPADDIDVPSLGAPARGGSEGSWVNVDWNDNEYWERDAYGRRGDFPDRNIGMTADDLISTAKKHISYETVKEEMLRQEEETAAWSEYDGWEERMSYLNQDDAESSEWDLVDDNDRLCAFPPCKRPFECDARNGDCHSGALATAFEHNRDAAIDRLID